MSLQSPCLSLTYGSAWQTASRSRNTNSTSRTPQNRSGTQSPSQAAGLSQPGPPRQDAGPPVNNVWTQRSSMISASNGQTRGDDSAESSRSLNGFNGTEVKEFLARDAGSVIAYKPAEMAGVTATNDSGAWMAASNMANGQPFFAQLAKQVATAEGGG